MDVGKPHFVSLIKGIPSRNMTEHIPFYLITQHIAFKRTHISIGKLNIFLKILLLKTMHTDINIDFYQIKTV